MRTPSKSTLPIEPLGTALGTARGVALTARDKGLELLDSDAAQELLRKGQHVAIVARDRGVELLESDAAQEFVRRGKGVVSAAKGELVEKPKKRKPIKMMLLLAGSAAGVAAAVLSKRMTTPLPNSGIPAYDDPSAQFPKKDGVVDLTSIAAEEGVAADPVKSMIEAGKAEIGTATKATATSKPATKTTAPKPASVPKATPPTTASATSGVSNGSTTRPTAP
ncbi:MAG TPA: hypothetical protein VNA14_05820 [Mycobacteriales bacterium]|nr:hypothetical protein [Mycobacteriales bacterium]